MYDQLYPWCYAWSFGWFVVHTSPTTTEDSFIVWDEHLGWVWSSETYYPWFYRYSDGVWYQWQVGTTTPRNWKNGTNGAIINDNNF